LVSQGTVTIPSLEGHTLVAATFEDHNFMLEGLTVGLELCGSWGNVGESYGPDLVRFWEWNLDSNSAVLFLFLFFFCFRSGTLWGWKQKTFY